MVVEIMDMTKDLLEDYRIRNTIISDYNPQMVGLVQCGHGPIFNSLTTYCCDSPESIFRLRFGLTEFPYVVQLGTRLLNWFTGVSVCSLSN